MFFSWRKLHSRNLSETYDIVGQSAETKMRLNRLKQAIMNAFVVSHNTEILICRNCEWGAVSIGKRIIMLDEKLLSCNDHQLQGYLAHEIAHQHIAGIPTIRRETLAEFPRMLIRDFLCFIIRPWLFIALLILFWIPFALLIGSRAASTSSRVVFTLIALVAFLVMSAKGILELAKPYAAKAIQKAEKELSNSDVFDWILDSLSKADNIKEKAMAGLRKFDPILLSKNIHDVYELNLNTAIDQYVCSCGLGNELLMALENDLLALDDSTKILSVKLEYERYSKYRNNIRKRIERIKSFVAVIT